MGSTQRIYSPGLFSLGLLVAALGLTFYLSNNLSLGSLADLPLALFFGSSALKAAVLGSFPSFTHALATTLLLASQRGLTKRTRFAAVYLVLAVLITLELSMGTYDIVDINALLLGTLLGCVALFSTGQNRDARNTVSVVPALLITAVSTTLAVGSYTAEPGCARYEGTTCVESKRFGTPVYMSYADLRSAIELESPHPLTEIGRLYLYKSLILMNEKNQGIHIIDNRFPTRPERIGFIRIPGNLDINIRDDYLYADSYVDLVTLDLSDIGNIREVNRDEGIFPYDAFQNIPSDIDFEYGVVDAAQGVIVGYE